jgi:4-hydroxy-tetrahydrodipicolinate synthase
MPVVQFSGTYTALVTPFQPDGSVDFDGFHRNIRFQIEQGITGVLPVGTTGESPTLSTDEHNQVVARSREFAGERCDIFAGAGSNSTREALGHCRHALEAGIDKVLLVDCYYNGPSSLELRREYYQPLLDELSGLKVIIYVIPGRTGTAISPVDIAVLSGEYDRVIAVKEATGDLERMAEERSLMPEMSIMSGDDDKTFEMLQNPAIRANGVISVTSNIAPAAVSRMTRALLEGDLDEAGKLHDQLKPLFELVTVKAQSERTLPSGRKVTVQDRFRNPLAVKTMMNVLGMPAGACRRPLGRMTREGAEKVRAALLQVHRESPGILAPVESFYGVSLEERLADRELWSAAAYGD